MARRRSSCGTLKQVQDRFKRALREAVRLAAQGREYQAGNLLKQAHGQMYWCARQEGYADVAHWQAGKRRKRRRGLRRAA